MADHGVISGIYSFSTTSDLMAVSNFQTVQSLPLHFGTVAIKKDEFMDDKYIYLQSFAIAGTGVDATQSSARVTVGQLYPRAV